MKLYTKHAVDTKMANL